MSSLKVAGFIAMMIILPAVVNEAGELAPWLAKCLLRNGAKFLGSTEATERYTEQWLADLKDVPGKITKLAWAFGLVVWGVPQLRLQERARARARRSADAGAARRLQWFRSLGSLLGRSHGRDTSVPLHVLRCRPFSIYLSSSLASNLGTGLQRTALILLVYNLTHSVLAVSLVTGAQFSGFLVLGPWPRVLTDRMSRTRVLVISQLATAGITAVLAVLQLNGKLTVHLIMIGAAATGLSSVFTLSAQAAIASRLVPKGDAQAALTMNYVSYAAGWTLGPALCAAILPSIGAGPVFGIDAALLVIAAIIVLAVVPRHTADHSGGMRTPASDDWRIAVRRPRILLLLAIVSAVTMASDPLLHQGPAYVRQVLDLPYSWSLYVACAVAAGTILGVIFAVPRACPRNAAVLLGMLACSVVVFATGISPWTSLFAAGFAGMAALMTGAMALTLLLNCVGSSRSLQVMGLWTVAWAGSQPIASLLDGQISSHYGMHVAAMTLAVPAVIVACFELALPQRSKQLAKDFMTRHNRHFYLPERNPNEPPGSIAQARSK
jgi:MFS family permease